MRLFPNGDRVVVGAVQNGTGRPLVHAGGAVRQLYTDADATTPASGLLAADGVTELAGGRVTIDELSRWPLFYAPDSVPALYDIDGNMLRPVGDDVTTAELATSAAAAQAAAVAAAATDATTKAAAAQAAAVAAAATDATTKAAAAQAAALAAAATDATTKDTAAATLARATYATVADDGRMPYSQAPKAVTQVVEAPLNVMRWVNPDAYYPDGSADVTTAINAAIAAMEARPSSFAASAGALYLPGGRYITSGGHVFAAGKRCQVFGDGPYNTIINRKAGSVGDLFTLNGSTSGVRLMTLDGNALSAPGGGDALVLNAPYTYADLVNVDNNDGDGIAIGKGSPAIAHRLSNILGRNNRGHGTRVYAGASTDGQWCNVDLGNSGKNGARLGASATMLTNVHVWGSGIETVVVEERAGILIESGAQMLCNCESEKNMGRGVLGVGAVSGVGITGGDFWGNGTNGMYFYGGASRLTITGARIRMNGVLNEAGSTSDTFANMLLTNVTESAFVGNAMWDAASALSAASYSGGYTPAYPFLGRSAVLTVPRHVSETGTSDFNYYANVSRTNRTRSGLANAYVGPNNVYGGIS